MIEIKLSGFETKLILNIQKPLILCIENINLFRKITEDIIIEKKFNLESNEIAFWEDLERISLYRKADVIIDFIQIDLLSTSRKNRIYKHISNSIQKTYPDAFKNLDASLKSIYNIIEDTVLDIDLPLILDPNYDLEKVIKLFNIQFHQEREYSLIDNIYAYIDFISLFDLYEFVFMVNLSNYVEKQELQNIVNYGISKQLNIIYLENKKITTDITKTIHIDQDYYYEEIE